MKEFKLDINTIIGGWFIPKRICKKLIKLFNDHSHLHHTGMVGNNARIIPEVKDSIDLSIDERELKNISGEFYEYGQYLYKCIKKYADKYDILHQKSKLDITERLSIQMYKPGGGFKKWHEERMSHNKRVITFMTYLNSLEDGGTHFKYQNLTTPAIEGLTVLWPADFSHTHKGQISNTKDKYIITGWVSFKD